MPSPLNFLSRPEKAVSPVWKLPTWLLPVGIFAGFGLLFAGLYHDRLLSAPAVPTAPVLTTSDSSANVRELGGQTSNGSPLFQASGWLEPDPYPEKASALIDGVVAAVHVRDGQDVEKGQLLATLVDDDAKLGLAVAEGRHRMLVSSRSAHLAAIGAMAKKLDGSRAEAMAAQTIKAEADDQLVRLDRLSKASAVSRSEFISARLRLQKEASLHQAAQAREGELEAEVQRMKLETQAKDDEIALAAVAVDQARLVLERTRIHAPIAGRVLRLMAAPGEKKMLSMDHPDSSIVCMLFDPAKLQVRVDVPLPEVAGLQVGQRARIHTSLLSDKVFEGEVTRIAGEADIQRNTLQAKVRILNPVDQMRPEMLCRVEFSGAGNSPIASPDSGTSIALWIPSEALQGNTVWVCDPDTNRLNKRTVQATEEKRDNHIRILAGLCPGEQVVVTPGAWREGQRILPQSTKL
jgi:multidrug efflux pump subunit AcrA (membrane-fusion protein)